MLLVTGGCRSGKSSFAREWAEKQADRLGKKPVYLATAYVVDEEMRSRIQRHRDDRGDRWRSVDVASLAWDKPEIWVPEAASQGPVLLFDCLTLWTSLCLEKKFTEEETLSLTQRLLAQLRQGSNAVALVANEVGLGLVPENAASRLFRDVAGRVNQLVAANADTVVLMISGLPLTLKGGV
ncbi:adenosylcobinamide kinase/adenosylcobinamide phosphate guanyltransferase [Deltaproteobacteria bacterium]|nr:adenosylcobinamide kinase/adenosylcobinamide phosphate guanyltransferase [Deltaproteobacteria bacterium]